MACPRCIASVQSTLNQLNIHYGKVDLGEIFIHQPLTNEQWLTLQKALLVSGFELIENKEQKIIETIKQLVRDYLMHEKQSAQKLSVFITHHIPHNYSYLSDLFSSVEGITIEKFMIRERIQKVKELIRYDDLSIGEIAHRLNFSSSQHLSVQFKKETGQTPSQFKAKRMANHQGQKLYTKK